MAPHATDRCPDPAGTPPDQWIAKHWSALKSVAWILLIIAVIVIAWRVTTGRHPV